MTEMSEKFEAITRQLSRVMKKKQLVDFLTNLLEVTTERHLYLQGKYDGLKEAYDSLIQEIKQGDVDGQD
jgi:hypothetical protein